MAANRSTYTVAWRKATDAEDDWTVAAWVYGTTLDFIAGVMFEDPYCQVDAKMHIRVDKAGCNDWMVYDSTDPTKTPVGYIQTRGLAPQ